MKDIDTTELAMIEGGSCAGAAGLATGLAIAGPFTEGLGFVAAWFVIGGMAIAGCN